METDIHNSDEFRSKLKKCTLFRLKRPRGGLYNDGFEILGTLVFRNGKELLKALDILEIDYALHDEKLPKWMPPPLEVEGRTYWIEYENYCASCLGHRTSILIRTGPEDYSIEFNFNSKSHYYVAMVDIDRALVFEKVLESKGLL